MVIQDCKMKSENLYGLFKTIARKYRYNTRLDSGLAFSDGTHHQKPLINILIKLFIRN